MKGFVRNAAVSFALLAVVACSPRDIGKTMPDDQVIKPSTGDSSWATTSVNGVEISVPTKWEKIGPISPGGDAEMFTFQTETNSFGTRGGAQLMTLDKYKHRAADLVENITSEAQAVAGAKRITETQLIWPGSDDAWLVTYVAYPPSNGEVAPHPTEVLVLDLPGGGQAQATVTALDDDFEPQHMHEILQTVTITKDRGDKTS